MTEPTPAQGGVAPPSPVGGLFTRLRTGALWSMGSYAGANVIRLASNLILTRLLAPDAFGLMLVVTSLQILTNMLSDFGLNASIIQSKRGTERSFIHTAWTLQIIRNGLIALVLGLIALSIYVGAASGVFEPGSVYTDPRLPFFIGINAIAMAMLGFQSLSIPLAERKLKMAHIAGFELTTQTVSTIATILMALSPLGAWGLALGSIVGVSARLAGSHLFVPGQRMGLNFDKEAVSEILHFGKWVLLASLFHFAAARGDALIFGFYMERSEYGFFSVAMIWITTAMSAFDLLINRLGMPAFAEINRDRPEERTKIYYRLRLLLDAAAIVGFLGLVLLSPVFIDVIYAPPYAPVAFFIAILAPRVLLMPIYLLRVVVLSVGDSRLFSAATFVPGAALLVGTPLIFSAFGTVAAAVYASATPLTMMPVLYYATRPYIDFDWRRELPLPLATLAGCLWLLSTSALGT